MGMSCLEANSERACKTDALAGSRDQACLSAASWSFVCGGSDKESCWDHRGKKNAITDTLQAVDEHFASSVALAREKRWQSVAIAPLEFMSSLKEALISEVTATVNHVIVIIYLHQPCHMYYFIYQHIWVIMNVFQWTKLAPSWNWMKYVKCVACWTCLRVTNSLSSTDIVLWKFVDMCEMCCRIACTI